MLDLFFLAIQYTNGREPQEVVGIDCHTVKSIGGTVFYFGDNVNLVTVTDREGFVWLNLDKENPDNNVSVPSALVNLKADLRNALIS